MFYARLSLRVCAPCLAHPYPQTQAIQIGFGDRDELSMELRLSSPKGKNSLIKDGRIQLQVAPPSLCIHCTMINYN